MIPDLKPAKREAGARNVIIYGTPGIGKTVFAADNPRTLFITTNDTHAHVSARICRVREYPEAIRFVAGLASENLEPFDYIVVDDIGTLILMIEQYISKQRGEATIGDVPYGKGWDDSKTHVARFFHEIQKLKNGQMKLMLIGHSKASDVVVGLNKYTKFGLDIPNYLQNLAMRDTTQILLFTTEAQARSLSKRYKKDDFNKNIPDPVAGDVSKRVILAAKTMYASVKDHDCILPLVFPMNPRLYWAYLKGWVNEGEEPEDAMKRLNIPEEYWKHEGTRQEFYNRQ